MSELGIKYRIFSSVQSLSHVQLFATPWTACRLPITNSQSLLKLMSVESVMPSNHLILSSPSPVFSLSNESFPVSRLFASGGQSIGASASASFSDQISRSVVSDSLRPHGWQHSRPPCPSPTPGIYPNSCPLSQ